MGGLSLGSWIAGRWGDRLRRPLVVYGACEIAIAGSGVELLENPAVGRLFLGS